MSFWLSSVNGRQLQDVVRETLKSRFGATAPTLPELPVAEDECGGVFVTLKDQQGDLRGCMGFIGPYAGNFSTAVEEMAQKAAFEDPRFSPVRPGEIGNLAIEISFLHPLEPTEHYSQLNPLKYGVCVQSGRKRGVLLPDIPGIDSVQQQLAIAKEKAQISPGAAVKVERFLVSKIG